jgi:hypothetical protein
MPLGGRDSLEHAHAATASSRTRERMTIFKMNSRVSEKFK